jgi:hypothetical protein
VVECGAAPAHDLTERRVVRDVHTIEIRHDVRTLAAPDWRNVQLMASLGESTWDDHEDHQSSRVAAKASSFRPWVVR